MSPEQIRAEPLDGRADIFALGVVLFELFSGCRPWNASTDLDAIRATTETPHADLLELRPKIDRALVQVVNQCLAKDPDERFDSAEELRDRFDEWLLVHGYRDDNQQALARFVRRNAMRQMRWFERAVAGEFAEQMGEGRSRILGRHIPGLSGAAHAVGDSGAVRDIDWGEDGPTLIQKDERARALVRRAVARPRNALPTLNPMSEPTTERRAATQSTSMKADGAESTSGSGLTTVPGNRAVPPDETAATRVATAPEDEGAADETLELSTAGAKVRHAMQASSGMPGVVAPHDPHVPPLPEEKSSLGEATNAQAPLPGRARSASPPVLPVSPPQGVPALRAQSGRAAVTALSPGGFRSTEPGLPGTGSAGTGSAGTGSAGTGSAGTGPAVASLGELNEEAARLALAANKAADAARRAAEVAEAAAHAASLAARAVLLSTQGDPTGATELLHEARRLDRGLEGGQVPMLRPRNIVPPHGAPRPRVVQLAPSLQIYDRLTIAVIAAVGFLVIVAFAALVW